MKVLFLLLAFLTFSNTMAQQIKCDTVVIIRNRFIKVDDNPIKFKKLKWNNCCFIENRWMNDDSSIRILSSGLIKSYYIFLDKKGRKIEEGYWHVDFFNDSYISYNKNGTISSRGKFDNDVKIGLWHFYDKYGRLIRSEIFN
ncbi:MAG: hypothetical protein CFE21_00075 [Bacteroidetes bacterium B1(2017)]|nr:MAG: hypothetical protein CFE21_00075 [Bacteroidetes bacterium B1(2017)]